MALLNGRAKGAEGALIGLAFAFFTLAGSQGDSRPRIAVFLVLALPVIMLAVGVTRRVGMAAVYLLALGVLIRLAILLGWAGVPPAGVGSDVLTVTWDALYHTLNGRNPYTTFMRNGYPFTYPPGNLLYYLPGFLLGWIRVTEIVSAAIVLAGLAWAVRLVHSDWPVAAMGVYAAALPLIILSTDNSNDTSAGALLFASVFLLLLARRQSSGRLLIVAGVVLGWALAFKQYLWVFWPLLIAHVASQRWRLDGDVVGFGRGKEQSVPAWLAYLGASAGFALLASLPFFLRSPGGFLRSLWIGPTLWHGVGGWNVWAAVGAWQGWNLDPILKGSLGMINIVLTGAVIAAGMVVGVRRPSHALGFGIAAWFTAMLFARWTTYAYFAGIAPVVLLLPFADRLAEHPEPVEEGENPGMPRQAGGRTEAMSD